MPAKKKNTETRDQKKDFWNWFKNPKSRKVIYGVTNRNDDPWYLKFNDFLLDHQPLSLKDKARFFHSLKLLVNSGVQFIRAIEMLANRSKHVGFSRTLHTIAYDMERNGSSFSASIQKFPKIFTPSEVKMVYSGELTGKIDQTLESIATQLQKNIELEMRIRSALMYPLTVIAAIVLAAVVVMMFIVPKLKVLFLEFDHQLPLTTKILVATSDFLLHFWWLVLTFIIGFWVWFKSWKHSEEGRRKYDAMMLKLPLVSELVNHIQTVRISSNFSTLMASGIPLNKALRVLGEIIPNRIIGESIFNVEMEVRKGVPLHEAFAKQKNLDPVLGEILEIGEKTGQIAPVLKKLSDQYELEVEAQLKNLSTIIEPLIILLVGVAVIFMMFAVMTPIFQIQELFSNAS